MSSSSETVQFCRPTDSKDNPIQQAQTKSSPKKQITLRATSASEKNQASMISPAPPSGGGSKSHKVEGKNKKSLHQKYQQQQLANLNQNCVLQHSRQQRTSQNLQQQQMMSTNSSNRAKKNNIGGSSLNPPSSSANNSNDFTVNICSTIEDFSRIAQELKADINRALAKQSSYQNTDQPAEVVKLKNDILKLSGIDVKESGDDQQNEKPTEVENNLKSSTKITDQIVDSTMNNHTQPGQMVENKNPTSDKCNELEAVSHDNQSDMSLQESTKDFNESSQEKSGLNTANFGDNKSRCIKSTGEIENGVTMECHSTNSVLSNALDKLDLNNQQENLTNSGISGSKSQMSRDSIQADDNSTIGKTEKINTKPIGITPEEFAPLNTRLDFESKLVTLTSSLQSHFVAAPHLLSPVCRKLVNMSDSNNHLILTCEKFRHENQRLLLVKQKLESLCRELQKSNNEIRIESLDLIKAEQGKAKEQTTKIQSTLSGVIKLFDENQQRNMSLRQENQDLQTKLKSLLDHCDNWEKSIEAALRQRDIENRLLKTELAKANLLKNEEQEKFLGEKQELLQILSMMQEQQHRIEGQEAKLRSDLSSYASKYDECQAVISKGMNRFQTESKRMLKQIEKSKQDYKVLLTKYETTNKRTTQLLEEKQEWHRSLNLANKKIEALEKLCRALREETKNSERITNNSSNNINS